MIFEAFILIPTDSSLNDGDPAEFTIRAFIDDTEVVPLSKTISGLIIKDTDFILTQNNSLVIIFKLTISILIFKNI
jgi:hypothetical protein